MRTFMILLAVSFLSGCLTQPSPEQYRDWVINQCLSYGFKQDDPSFSQCMMQVDQNERQRRASIAQGLIMRGPPTYSAPAITPIPPIQNPKRTQCSPDGMGGMTCTTY